MRFQIDGNWTQFHTFTGIKTGILQMRIMIHVEISACARSTRFKLQIYGVMMSYIEQLRNEIERVKKNLEEFMLLVLVVVEKHLYLKLLAKNYL